MVTRDLSTGTTATLQAQQKIVSVSFLRMPMTP